MVPPSQDSESHGDPRNGMSDSSTPDAHSDPYGLDSRAESPGPLAEELSSIPPDLPADSEASYNPARSGVMGPAREESPTFHPDLEEGIEPDSGPGAPPPARVATGRVPGPRGFELHQRVGRGGCGEVWEATQASLLRRVAIKRIRRDVIEVYDENSQERDLLLKAFRREALTAGNLEHPNIVPVHELGVDERGEPLLAMKLVRGRPWNKVIKGDFESLPQEEYLAKHLPILLSVSQAVAFAHSKGILHRDIKPSQVMVGDFGEVLLVDWGLALPNAIRDGHAEELHRAMGPVDDQLTNPAGTPAYMAPEQTDLDTRRLGSWTDVYLLGGTLYYLLTRHPPHQGDTRDEVYLRAMQGTVKPMQDCAPGRAIPPELAALVRDALDPNPQSRIRTAQEFAARLRDCMSGAVRRRESRAIAEEVAARLPGESSDYRALADLSSQILRARLLWPGNPEAAALRERVLTEFARGALRHGDLMLAEVQAERKEDAAGRGELMREIAEAREAARRDRATRRLAIGGVAALAVIVVATTITYTVGMSAQVRRTEDARRRAEELNRKLEAEAAATARARGDAEDLVTFMLTDLNSRLDELGGAEALAQVASRSLRYFESIPEGEMKTRDRLNSARAFDQLASVQWKLKGVDKAAELSDRALVLAREAIRLSPADADAHMALSEALRTRGILYMEEGRDAACLEHYQEALAELQRGMEINPALPLGLHTRTELLDEIGEALRSLGRIPESRAAFEESRSIREQELAKLPTSLDWRRALVDSYRHLAKVDLAEGRFPEAESGFRRHLDELEVLCRENPAARSWKQYLASGYDWLASLYSDSMHEPGKAEEPLRRAAELYEELISRDPSNFELLRSFAVVQARRADALVDGGRLSEGLAGMERAVELLRRARDGDSENSETMRYHAVGLSRMAAILVRLGQHEEAAAKYAEALDTLKSMRTRLPGNVDVVHSVSTTSVFTGDALLEVGRLSEARGMFEQGLQAAQEEIALGPASTEQRRHLAVVQGRLGSVERDLGNLGEARRHQELAVEGMSQLAMENPGSMVFNTSVASAQRQLAVTLGLMGLDGEALATIGSALENAELGAEGEGPGSLRRLPLGASHREMARVLRRAGRGGEALAHAEESLAIARAFQAVPGEDWRPAGELVDALLVVAGTLTELGRAGDALPHLEESRLLCGRFITAARSHPDAMARLADTHVEEGLALEKLGQDGEAIVAAESAISTAMRVREKAGEMDAGIPQQARAYVLLARVAERRGDRATARAHFNSAIAALDSAARPRAAASAAKLRAEAEAGLERLAVQ